MPRNKDERLKRLEKLNPESHIIPINQLLLSHLESLADSERKYSDNPLRYNTSLQSAIAAEKAKTKTPPGLINRALSKNPKTVRVVGRGIAAAGAMAIGGVAAGVAATVTADFTESIVTGAIQNSFSGVTGSGLVGSIMSPLVDGLATNVGKALGTVVNFVLPIALLLVITPIIYDGLSYVFDKVTTHITKTPADKSQELRFLPEKGPLLDLMCLLSTFALIETLTKKLQLKGFDKVRFNVEKITNKLKDPTNRDELTNQDKMLYFMAKDNAKFLANIARNAQDPKKLEAYKNSSVVHRLIDQFQPFFPDAGAIQNDEKIMACLAITATVIEKEDADVQQVFSRTLRDALNGRHSQNAVSRSNISSNNSVSGSSSHVYANIHPQFDAQVAEKYSKRSLPPIPSPIQPAQTGNQHQSRPSIYLQAASGTHYYSSVPNEHASQASTRSNSHRHSTTSMHSRSQVSPTGSSHLNNHSSFYRPASLDPQTQVKSYTQGKGMENRR